MADLTIRWGVDCKYPGCSHHAGIVVWSGIPPGLLRAFQESVRDAGWTADRCPEHKGKALPQPAPGTPAALPLLVDDSDQGGW
jgi:hypothetical protein